MAGQESTRSPGALLLTLLLSLVVLGGVFLGSRLSETARAIGVPNLSSSSKQVSSATATPGQVVTCTITLANSGQAATVSLTDTLPASLAYVPGSATNGAVYVAASNTITWTGQVDTSGTALISYSGVISGSLANGTLITNTAVISDGVNSVFSL